MDRAVSHRVDRVTAGTMATKIDQNNLSAMSQARFDIAELVPKTAALAEVVQHHHRRPSAYDLEDDPDASPRGREFHYSILPPAAERRRQKNRSSAAPPQ
jgi:hypothetical protein